MRTLRRPAPVTLRRDAPRRVCRTRVICGSSTPSPSNTTRTARLRTLLARPGILLGPAAYDGISAKLTEEAGFDFGFMSGFSVAAARLGLPDTGLVSYGEMVEQGRQMVEATSRIPLIGDGDTGGGNAMNVKRTVWGYSRAGLSGTSVFHHHHHHHRTVCAGLSDFIRAFSDPNPLSPVSRSSGILIEDQVWPKSCGHVRGKRVVGRDEAVQRIKAACDARDEGADIVIVARTDAKQAVSFQEALERAQLFADAGADVVFIDALETEAEMRTFCSAVQGIHKMANMLEGGGKTPILTPEELEAMGFKLVAYPLSLLGVSIRAMREALVDLKSGKIPNVPEFGDLQEVCGFNAYFAEEKRYAADASPHRGPREKAAEKSSEAERSVVEPDAIFEEGAGAGDRGPTGYSDGYKAGATSTYDVAEAGRVDRSSLWLRIKVLDKRNQNVVLDTRFPAGFLNGIASVVPQVANVDLATLLTEAEGKSRSGEPIYYFELDDERVEIYLE